MAVTVSAWNISNGFSDIDTATGIIDTVEAQQPTAAIFSEAWHEGEEQVLDDACEAFDTLGYQVTPVRYDDDDIRANRHGILGIIRREAVNNTSGAIRLVGRSAVHLSMADPENDNPIELFGVHLNDRNERTRLEQARALLAIIGNTDRSIVGGDFNAMYAKVLSLSQAFRLAGPLLQLVPEINYPPGYQPVKVGPKVHRALDRARRVSEMAQGTTLQTFVEAGFHDADPEHRPTIRHFNVDHILARGLAVADQQTHPQTPYSDHRAVSATLV